MTLDNPALKRLDRLRQDAWRPYEVSADVHGPYSDAIYMPGPIALHGQRQMADLFYDANGDGIEAALLRRSEAISRVDRVKRPIRPATVLRGTWWFGGYVFKAFGHNISEGMSRLWAPNSHGLAGNMLKKDRLQLVFVDVTKHGLSEADIAQFRETVQLFLRADADIHILRRHACRVETLLVPDADLEYPFGISPMLHVTYGTYRRNRLTEIENGRLEGKITAPKLYLSRSKLGRDGTASDFREITNEPEIETVFADHGYTIVHPQDLSMREQIDLYLRARVMAGPNGSALHNCIFSLDCTAVIQLLTPPRIWGAKLQNTLCQFLGIHQIDLAAEPTDPENRIFFLDPSTVEAALEGVDGGA